MRADGRVGQQIAQRNAVATAGEKRQHEQKRHDLRHHRGLGGAGRAAPPLHDEHVVKHDVDDAGKQLHRHGVGHLPAVADKRSATGDEHLKRRSDGDDLQVVHSLDKRFALAAKRCAQLLGEQDVEHENGN